MTIHPALDSGIKLGFAESYLEALALVKRLHRLLLDVIKDEFERINVLEINPVQALLLFRAFPAHLESLWDSHGCDFVIPS